MTPHALNVLTTGEQSKHTYTTECRVYMIVYGVARSSKLVAPSKSQDNHTVKVRYYPSRKISHLVTPSSEVVTPIITRYHKSGSKNLLLI